jgi:hypothetical protein
MDNGVGLELPHYVTDKIVFAQIAYEGGYLASCDLFPSANPIAERIDGNEGFRIKFELPTALGEVIENGDIVFMRGQVHGGWPAQIAITTQD